MVKNYSLKINSTEDEATENIFAVENHNRRLLLSFMIKSLLRWWN